MNAVQLLFLFYFVSVASIVGYLFGYVINSLFKNLNIAIILGVVVSLFIGTPLIVAVL